MIRSELTIAMIPSSTCAAERRDACAISPSAKNTMRLSQFGAIMMNGRIVLMDMGLATCLWDQPAGEVVWDCTRIAEDLRSLEEDNLGPRRFSGYRHRRRHSERHRRVGYPPARGCRRSRRRYVSGASR